MDNRLRIFPVLACVGLLAACGSQGGGAGSSDHDGKSASVSKASSTYTVKGEGGSMSVHAGDNLDVSLPQGFTMPAGAKVTAVQNMSAGGKEGAMMVYFESADSPEKIVDHFRKQAEAAGITIGLDMTTETGKIASSTDEKSRRFSITADNEKGKTQGTLMIGTEAQ